MAFLRGGTKIWNAATVAQNNTSEIAYIGPGPWVVVYINSSGAASIDVQVAPSDAIEAGLNALTSTAVNQDGGLVWHGLNGHTGIAVAANTPIAIDLSPFGAQFIRLKRTDATGTPTITAWVSAFGG